jgi:protein-S-isoprenylcysteine O-methyltransferase Ste14
MIAMTGLGMTGAAMTALNVHAVVTYAWGAVGLVWLVGLAFTKRTVRAQSPGTRLFHLGLVALGFSLLSGQWIKTGWLAMRFVPEDRAIALTGLLLTIAGCAFAIWARVALGSNWSGRATVKDHHQLVTNGPYAVARHPIYTGLMLAVVGTALADGAWRGILAALVILLALMVKMSQEERLMMQTFPAAYPAYRQRVKALVPGIF